MFDLNQKHGRELRAEYARDVAEFGAMPGNFGTAAAGSFATIPAALLLDMVASAAAFTDKKLPQLAGVYVELNGGTLTVSATDRYALLIGEVDVLAHAGEFSGMFSVDALTAALKAMSGQRVRVAGNFPHGLTLETLTGDIQISNVAVLSFDYPRSFRELMPEMVQEFTAAPTIFDPQLLAKLSKIKLAKVRGENSASMQIWLDDKTRFCARVEDSNGVTWRAVIMPRRAG
jgi:hypothetical protein